jgi:hypothetical protein
MYNITFMNTSNNLYEYFVGVNTASNSLLSILILMMLWVVIFIAMKHFDTKVVFLASSLTTTLIGLIFFAAELISMGILFIPILMTMFSLVALWWSRE